jgi:GcrA cell cycle regulator
MGAEIWSEESETQLRELWFKGLSGSQIAAKIGKTRNAVIGKVNRLGIGDQKGGVTIPGPKPMSMHPEAIRARIKRAADKSGVKPFYPPRPKKDVARKGALEKIAVDFSFPESRRVSIIELRNIHCRFPLGTPGEDGFCYCGADRETLETFKPYCAGHAAIAYRPAPALKVRAYR